MISGNYKEVTREEALRIAPQYAEAWTGKEIAERQLEWAAKPEIDKYRKGAAVLPFDALVQCLLRIEKYDGDIGTKKILDVGGASGYYSEILKIAGFKNPYSVLDISEHFKNLCEKNFPGTPFFLGDARELPFDDNTWDILISGCCMLHIPEYEQIVSESVRVAKDWVIFHRTPVVRGRPTQYFVKEAYGIPCIEIHFEERELLNLFYKHGLMAEYIHDVFWTQDEQYGHKDYLLRKVLK